MNEQTTPTQSSVESFLEVYRVSTGERTTLRSFDYLIEAPNWTKDGRYLIYNSLGKLYSYDLETGESTEIYSGFVTFCNNDHVLSSDGVQIAASHQTKEDGQSRIYTLPLAGGEPVLITPIAPSYLHGWSPDGKTLAYCAERHGKYNIYTIPAIGGEETQLTDTDGLDDGPEYSPSGEHIWFNSTRTGLMQVWRMECDGKNPEQMTTDESNSWFPHVSPDGQQVVYITYRKGDVDPLDHPPGKHVELRLMSATGGAYRTLVSLYGGQGTINVNSWAPDSDRFAFVSYREKFCD